MAQRPRRTRTAAARTSIGLLAAALLAACTTGEKNYGDPEPPTGPTGARSPGTTGPPPLIVGRELPVAVTDRQPGIMDYYDVEEAEPRAPDGASVLDQVTAELRRETLLMAEVTGKVTARCEGNRVTVAPRAVTSCTSTFDGVEIPWSVQMDGNASPGTLLISYYDLEPSAELLTSKRVYNAFWVSHIGQSDQFRCDQMPASFRVDRGTRAAATETGYHCQYLGWPENNVRTWVDVPIKVTDEGDFAY